jgi:hypothetical protein
VRCGEWRLQRVPLTRVDDVTWWSKLTSWWGRAAREIPPGVRLSADDAARLLPEGRTGKDGANGAAMAGAWSTAMALLSSGGLRGDALVLRLGRYFLHLAARAGAVKVVRALVAEGSSLDAAAEAGETALHLASQEGHELVVRALLGDGCNGQ